MKVLVTQTQTPVVTQELIFMSKSIINSHMIPDRKKEGIGHLIIEQIRKIGSEILNQVEYLKSNHIRDIQGRVVGHHPKVSLGEIDLCQMKEENNHIIDIQGQKVGPQTKISLGEIDPVQMKKESNHVVDIRGQEAGHQMQISLGEKGQVQMKKESNHNVDMQGQEAGHQIQINQREIDLGQMREGLILEKDMSQDPSTAMEVKEVGQDLQIVNIQDTAHMVAGHQ